MEVTEVETETSYKSQWSTTRQFLLAFSGLQGTESQEP